MSDEPNKPHLSSWIVRGVWSVVLPVALYAASFGPVWGLCWQGWISREAFLAAYHPMIVIQRAGGAVGETLGWYRDRFAPSEPQAIP